MRTIATDKQAWSVCLSVCLSLIVCWVLIDFADRGVDRARPIRRGTYGRHLADMIERSVLGSAKRLNRSRRHLSAYWCVPAGPRSSGGPEPPREDAFFWGEITWCFSPHAAQPSSVRIGRPLTPSVHFDVTFNFPREKSTPLRCGLSSKSPDYLLLLLLLLLLVLRGFKGGIWLHMSILVIPIAPR